MILCGLSTPAALVMPRPAQSGSKSKADGSTVGGNHQIPSKGTGDVKMKIKDTKGKERIIVLNDVLYAPDQRFNQFSINFPNAKKCVLFLAHYVKFKPNLEAASRFISSKPINGL
ncbi:Hypothetical protein PHPALM_7082 [Phytophthora palmivora]|uniref:Retrovirus-related Pol polyprotein from transposon TNT 1-94-like beta-barrel domain-containing protein n=1 Tax=Phytophthora palmivora TaxID=4796 RepID=A0A2P4YD85_9STRA|nr:Hypothetical protein PHPALM_7082 [Phytophthora palmivora]